MEQRHDRLRLAWKRSGLSQAQCVERFGFNANTLRANLNGNANFGFSAAEEYARAFNVRAEWLYQGTEPMRPIALSTAAALKIPVINWGELPNIITPPRPDDPTVKEILTTADLPAGDYIAATIKNDAMDRLAPIGAKIIIDMADKALLAGRAYLIEQAGEAMFRLWEPEPMGYFTPYSTNPAHRPIFMQPKEDIRVIGRVRRALIDL
jgi:phage repressor protein C with HTH and peptisase S24 domain